MRQPRFPAISFSSSPFAVSSTAVRGRHCFPPSTVRSRQLGFDEGGSSKYWDKFYKRHQNKFFKDRHYLEKDWGKYFSDDSSASPNGKVVLETIEYLLGINSVKDQANVKNQNGSTALDVVEHCPNRDLKTMEIREILSKASVRSGGLGSIPESPPDNTPPPPSQRRGKVRVILQCIYWFWLKYFKADHTWLKEVRGHLITAATLTATMAYQAILSPPGGFWQDSGSSKEPNPAEFDGHFGISDVGYHFAGIATMDSRTYNISGSSFSDSYTENPIANYLIINTVMLMASLCTIMLALSGFPADNKLLIWLLIFTVYITISCMGLGYLLAMMLVFPETYDSSMWPIVGFFLKCWIGVCGFVLVLHIWHFLVWLCNKFAKLWNKFGNLEWPRKMFGYLVKTCTRSRGPRAFERLQP